MNEHDDPGHTPAHYVEELAAFRRRKDAFFASDPQSPIPALQQSTSFTGLRYYPPDLAYRVEAELVPFDFPTLVTLGTTQGELARYVRYGELRFRIIGQECRLTAYRPADDPQSSELFVPFRDATTGQETYGAGRYLDVPDDRDASAGPHTLVVDFNLAYNPWCAYNADYSCTLPPPENTLPVGILAGERAYPEDA
jgi:uncharacterized protein (DUF1684 family)